MRLFGLIGYPLSHSFSKKYFTEKFEKERRTDCRYELFEIKSVHELRAIIEKHPELEGLNVTIPYKQLVLRQLSTTENIPNGLRACNCIKIKDGRLSGYNTDVIGFEKSFSLLSKKHHSKALVLGNGGATAAVVFVLHKLGIEYKIVSRQLHEGSDITYRELTAALLKEYTVIINTTPLGMYPSVNEAPPIPYEALTSKHYLFDLIYNPEKSLFLQHGERHGASIKNGWEMLVLQAEESWTIWNS